MSNAYKNYYINNTKSLIRNGTLLQQRLILQQYKIQELV